MKKIAVALVALMSLTAAVQAQTPKDLLAAMLVKWNKPTEPFKMIGNVYYVGTEGLASYLITSPQGHILVDTVMPEATSQIKANIEKLGFKVTDIKYLLNTHAHIDHTGGLAEMKAGQRRPGRRGRSRQAAARRRLLSGRAGRNGARFSAGEGRSHGARRRQGHGGGCHADRPRNPRPFAGLHELGILGEGRRCHALRPDLLQRHRGAEPPRRQPDLFRASLPTTGRRSHAPRT